MKSAEKLMDMLCAELDEIAEKGEMSAGDLDTVYKLIVSKEKLLRTEELEGDLGYSQDGGWNATGTYSNAYGNGYGSGNSYASRRGMHYVRGHYSRSGGRYSMDDGKKMLIEEMQDMISNGGMSTNDRLVLEKAMGIMQK